MIYQNIERAREKLNIKPGASDILMAALRYCRLLHGEGWAETLLIGETLTRI